MILNLIEQEFKKYGGVLNFSHYKGTTKMLISIYTAQGIIYLLSLNKSKNVSIAAIVHKTTVLFSQYFTNRKL